MTEAKAPSAQFPKLEASLITPLQQQVLNLGICPKCKGRDWEVHHERGVWDLWKCLTCFHLWFQPPSA